MTNKDLLKEVAKVTKADKLSSSGLPSDSQERKTYPLYSGLMCYFPRALAAIAHHSFVNNDKHNPGEPLHWAREKSADHADALLRHVVEGDWLSTAWRALAQLELALEAEAQQEFPWKNYNVRDGWTNVDPVDVKKPRVTIADLTELAELMYECAPEEVKKALGPPQQTVDAAVGFQPCQDCDSECAAAPICGPKSIAQAPRRPRAYLAGPMRGYKMFNWPAFKLATALWTIRGYDIISPADMDEEVDGLDPISDPEGAEAQVAEWVGQPGKVDQIVRRDIEVIMGLNSERGDCLIMLPGWRKSTGAQAEYRLAKWRGLARYDALSGKPLED